MRIKAAVLREYHQDFIIEEVELAEPGQNQVLVKIAGCGVCHTDEVVRDGHRTPMPAVLGHEGAGVVEKVGSNVTSVAPGDHVVLSFPYCGVCPNCRSGRPNICYDTAELCFGGRAQDGSTPLSLDGKPLSLFFGQSSFATHAVVDLSCVVKVDPEADLRLLGPLGCGIQTGAGVIINTFNPQPGSSVAIFGIGSVGLSASMAAKACGCTKIIAVDVVESRLKTALDLGATHAINGKNVTDLAAEVKKIVPQGVDYSFDTTGVADCLKGALMSLRRGGSGAGVAIVGPVEVERWSSLFSAKTWRQVTEGDSIPHLFIPRLIEMYKAGIFPIDRIISFYPFEEINEAFKSAHTGGAIKPVLVME
jgi:aryl-alcohol dehydrogenase